MSTERERLLSEFIDAWNAGERPDVDDYIARAPEDERGELADELVSFLTFAPTPAYDEAALEAIRAEPAVAKVLAAAGGRSGLLPALLRRMRERLSLSNREVATELVRWLELPSGKEQKTADYLDRLEGGRLEPSRVSSRVWEGLARVFGVSRAEIEGAGEVGWLAPPAAPAAAPVFRAPEEAAREVRRDLEVLADALAAPGGAERDEVDELFLGGR